MRWRRQRTIIKHAIRMALGRPIYGLGFWIMHGRSAWKEPTSVQLSFTGNPTPRQAAEEAMRVQRAIDRGDTRPLFFNDSQR